MARRKDGFPVSHCSFGIAVLPWFCVLTSGLISSDFPIWQFKNSTSKTVVFPSQTCLFVCLFENRVSLCSSGYPGADSVDLASIKLRGPHSFGLPSTGITGIHHHIHFLYYKVFHSHKNIFTNSSITKKCLSLYRSRQNRPVKISHFKL